MKKFACGSFDARNGINVQKHGDLRRYCDKGVFFGFFPLFCRVVKHISISGARKGEKGSGGRILNLVELIMGRGFLWINP